MTTKTKEITQLAETGSYQVQQLLGREEKIRFDAAVASRQDPPPPAQPGTGLNAAPPGPVNPLLADKRQFSGVPPKSTGVVGENTLAVDAQQENIEQLQQAHPELRLHPSLFARPTPQPQPSITPIPVPPGYKS